MRPAFAYSISAFVHVLAYGAVRLIVLIDDSVEYRVASGEPIVVQLSMAAAEQQPQPQPVKLELIREPAPQPPVEETRPTEHAVAPQPVNVERRPTAEVGELLAQAEPSPAEQDRPTESLPTQTAAEIKPPVDPEQPPPPQRQVTAEIAVETSVAMLAQTAQQAGAKVDDLPQRLPANPEPPYPTDAWLAGREGKVVLRVLILASGLVEKVAVEYSSGWASFDDSASTTVSRWRFSPARRGGTAVSFEVLIPVQFQIRRS